MSNIVSCPKCNTKTFSNASSCPNCGEPFPRKKTTWIFWAIGIFFFFIIIGLFSDSSESTTNQQITTNNDSNSPTIEVKSSKEEALQSVSIENFEGRKDGFGNILMANFIIKNGSKYTIKDIELTCKSYANSGTELDSNSRRIYEIINANDTFKVKDFNMGFINNQVVRSGCEVTDLEIK